MEIKEYIELIIDRLEKNPRDTTPERIRANRSMGDGFIGGGRDLKGKVVIPEPVRGIGKVYVERKKVKEKVGKNDSYEEWELLVGHWYKYFDTGYMSPINIDELPRLIIEKGKKLLEVL